MPDQETTRLDRLGTTELEPGWTEGLDMARYLGDGAVSASILWKLHQETPAHLHHELLHGEDDPTDAQNLGHLIHTLVYEPDDFEDRYVVIGQCEARTRAGERCGNQGTVWRDGASFCGVRSHDPEAGAPMPDGVHAVKEPLKAAARDMHARLMAEPTCREILTAPGPREVTGVWQDEETGLWCRIRPDQLIDQPPTVRPVLHRSVANLKSTGRLAGPGEYRRHAERLGYHFRAAFYRMGVEELSWWPQSFLYPVIEQTPPHEPIVYRLDDDSLDIAEAEVREALDRLAECVETGTWPGWGREVHNLALSEWRLKQVHAVDFLEVA